MTKELDYAQELEMVSFNEAIKEISHRSVIGFEEYDYSEEYKAMIFKLHYSDKSKFIGVDEAEFNFEEYEKSPIKYKEM